MIRPTVLQTKTLFQERLVPELCPRSGVRVLRITSARLFAPAGHDVEVPFSLGGDVGRLHSTDVGTGFANPLVIGGTPVTVGRCLYISFGLIHKTMTVSTINDDKGNVYTQTTRTTDTTGNDSEEDWLCSLAKIGVTGFIFTFTNGSAGFINCHLYELSNVDPVNPLWATPVGLSEQPSTANINGPSITVPVDAVGGIIIGSAIASSGISSCNAPFTYSAGGSCYLLVTNAGGTFSPVWVNAAGTWCGSTIALSGSTEDYVVQSNPIFVS